MGNVIKILIVLLSSILAQDTNTTEKPTSLNSFTIITESQATLSGSIRKTIAVANSLQPKQSCCQIKVKQSLGTNGLVTLTPRLSDSKDNSQIITPSVLTGSPDHSSIFLLKNTSSSPRLLILPSASGIQSADPYPTRTNLTGAIDASLSFTPQKLITVITAQPAAEKYSTNKLSIDITQSLLTISSPSVLIENETTSSPAGNRTEEKIILPNDGSVTYLLLGFYAFYVALLVYLRRKDEKDAGRICGVVLPPHGNLESKTTDWYELQFITGEERGSGTTASVFTKLLCSNGVSQIFRFADPLNQKRKLFKTGSVSTFLCPVPRHLGDPEGLILWHDNTGNDPCWMLRSVGIRDVSSEWSKLFVFNNWLSLLQPGCRTLTFLTNEANEKKNISESHAWLALRTCIINGHLWLSIVFSSPLSRLRKTQRLSCLLVLIVTLIFTLAMSFRESATVDNRDLSGLVCLDKACFIWDDVATVIKSALLAWAVSLLVVFTFQYSEQKERYLFQYLAELISNKPPEPEKEVICLPEVSAPRPRTESIDSGCIMSPDCTRTRSSTLNDLDAITIHTTAKVTGEERSGSVSSRNKKNYLENPANSYIINLFGSPATLGRGRVRANSVSPTVMNTNRKSISGLSVTSEGSRSNASTGSESVANLFMVDSSASSNSKTSAIYDWAKPRRSLFKDTVSGLRKRPYYAMQIPKALLKESQEKYVIPDPLVYFIWVVVTAASIGFSYMTWKIADPWSNNTTKIFILCVIISLILDVVLLQFILPIIDVCRIVFYDKSSSVGEIKLRATRNIWSNIQDQWMKVFQEQTLSEFYKDYEKYAPFAPKDISKTKEKMKSKREVTTLMYSFPYYFTLIAVLLAVCYGNRDPSAFQIRGHMEDIFVKSMSFEGVKLDAVDNIPTIWKWWDSTMLPGLFNKSDYMLRLPRERGLSVSLTDRESVLIGVPRVRQLRVQKDSCNIAPDFKTVIPECNDFYEWSNEDTGKYYIEWSTEPNNLTMPSSINHSPWEYMSGSQVNNSISVWGEMAVYKGGGYLTELGRDLGKAQTSERHLEKNQWIDKYSRAIITELTVYNPNINLVAYLIVTLDILPMGLVLQRYDMGIFRLYRYLYPYQWGYLFCEIIVLLFVLHTLKNELMVIYRQRFKYLKSVWNLNQITFVVSGLSMAGFYILREQYLSDGLKQFNENHYRYVSFYQIAVFDELIVYMLAVMELSAVLQFIHFLSFQKGITIIMKTLGSAAIELGGFYSFIAVWIMAFASYAYLKFVSEVDDFSEMTSTMRSLLSLLLGGLRYEEYQNNSPYMLAFMFIFIVIMYLVVANVFISIIQRSHTSVATDFKGVKAKYSLSDVGKTFMDKVFGRRASRYIRKKFRTKKREVKKSEATSRAILRKKSSKRAKMERKRDELKEKIMKELEDGKSKKDKVPVQPKSATSDNVQVLNKKRPPKARKKQVLLEDPLPDASQALKFVSTVQATKMNEFVNVTYSDLFAEDFVFMENVIRLLTNKTIDIDVCNIKREVLKNKACRKPQVKRSNSLVKFRGVSRSILIFQHAYKKVQKNREDMRLLQDIVENSNEDTLTDTQQITQLPGEIQEEHQHGVVIPPSTVTLIDKGATILENETKVEVFTSPASLPETQNIRRESSVDSFIVDIE